MAGWFPRVPWDCCNSPSRPTGRDTSVRQVRRVAFTDDKRSAIRKSRCRFRQYFRERRGHVASSLVLSVPVVSDNRHTWAAGVLSESPLYVRNRSNMPTVAVLAIEGCYASCATGVVDVMQAANTYSDRPWDDDHRPFEWRFVSAEGGPVLTSNGLTIETRPFGRDRFDIVSIPALHYPGYKMFTCLLDGMDDTYAWLRDQWHRGAWIGTHCTGVFVLAQSGLLDGRAATTTWWLDRQFRSRYPKVDLRFRSMLSEADRILCAAALATHLLQAIRFVDLFMGRAVAVRTAKSTMIDMSETGRIPYLPIMTETRHNDFVVERAQQWLRKHMSRDIGVTDAARAVAVSERTLARKFNMAIGQTPLAYLQTLRLEAARTLLEAGDLTVDSVASQVGYVDASSFSRLFKQELGVSPGAYRRRFRASVLL